MKDQKEYLEKHCFGNGIEQEFCVRFIARPRLGLGYRIVREAEVKLIKLNSLQFKKL